MGMLELKLPASILDVCHILSSHSEATTYMLASDVQGVNMKLSIEHKQSYFTLTFEGDETTVFQKADGSWSFSVISARPVDIMAIGSSTVQEPLMLTGALNAQPVEGQDLNETEADSECYNGDNDDGGQVHPVSLDVTADAVSGANIIISKEALEETASVDVSDTESPKQFIAKEQTCGLCQQRVGSLKALREHICIRHKMTMFNYRQELGLAPVRLTCHKVPQSLANNAENQLLTGAPLQQPSADDNTNGADDQPPADCHLVKASATSSKEMPSAPGSGSAQAILGGTGKKRNFFKTSKGYHCSLCRRRYSYLATLRRHLVKLHSGSPQLELALLKLEELQQTMHTRRSPIRRECPICGQVTWGGRSMSHMRRWHKDHPDFENIVTKWFKEQTDVTSKLLNVYKKKQYHADKGEYCCKCGKTFQRKLSLWKHFRYRCSANPKKRVFYNCTTCSAGFATRLGYEKHLVKHKEKPSQFVCDHCGKRMKTRSSLLQHCRRVHDIAKVKPITRVACQKCPKTFYDTSHLKRHMNTHSDVILCQCDLCGKGFKGREEMKRHMRTIHLNMYRYQCEKCGHGIDQKRDLESHVCGRTKNRASNLAFRNLKTGGGEKTSKMRPRGKRSKTFKAEEYNGGDAFSGTTSSTMQQDVSIGHMELVDMGEHMVAIQYLSGAETDESQTLGQPAFYTFQEELK